MEENVIPDEADLSQMSWAFADVLKELCEGLPRDVTAQLEQIGNRIVNDARRDIHIFAQQLQYQSSRKQETPRTINYTTNINAPSYGGTQQGGQNNNQSVPVNAEFESRINELATLVENSSLTPAQKLKAVSDIRTFQELA